MKEDSLNSFNLLVLGYVQLTSKTLCQFPQSTLVHSAQSDSFKMAAGSNY